MSVREILKMALHILHVVPLAPDGGTSGFIRRQIDRLAEAGVEGQSVLFGGSAMLFRPHQLLIGISKIRRKIRMFRPDIVHAHWGSLLAFATALGSLGCAPFVITYRGSDINPVPSEPWSRSLIRVACSQLAALRAAAIICVSDDLRERLWARREFVRIVPDGTDASLFKPLAKLECRRKLNWPLDERVVFFYEGGRPAVKRRDLADASLEEARKLLGSCRLEVMGSDMPHDRVPLLLNASDCLLMTSDFEGSPNIVREALAFNLPIISVDVGDVRRWLDGLDGTRMVSRDPTEIGRALAEIIATGNRPAGESRTAQFSDVSSRDAVLETYHHVLNDVNKLRR
jgi:teichuronic acid biosynthesis glycosyltransferase TuaC